MKKLLIALGAASLVAVSLTGCAPTSSVVADTTLTIGQDALASSLNNGLLANETTQESNAYLHDLTQTGFYKVGASGELEANTAFGHAEVIANEKDNFTVSYLIKRGVTWNDGTRIDAADLLVSWAAARNLADAGFTSTLSSTGLAAAETAPEIRVNGRRLVVKFAHPVADWQTAMQLTVPAHLLGKLAFKTEDPQEAKKQVTEAITGSNAEKLKTLAAQFNTGFNLTEADATAGQLFSSGAYDIVSANSTTAVLKAKSNCLWCGNPTVETVTIKFYENPSKLLDAVKASEVDLAEALDTSNLPLATWVAEVTALESAGYKYSTLQSGKIQALILNYGKNSLFGEQKFFRYAKSIEAGRQALLLMTPRQRITDALSIPIKLTRADSFVYLSTQQEYDAVTQSNGSAAYRIQDAEKAKELMARQFLNRKFGIRILFDTADLNSQIAFNLMNQYASDARIPLANGSSSDVAGVLASGKYEAYLTQIESLSSSPSALGAIQNAPSSKPSDKLNELIAKLAGNPASNDRAQILADIDAELFASGYGLPLYELPKVVIFSNKLKNYASPSGANSAVSNFELWNVAPEKQ